MRITLLDNVPAECDRVRVASPEATFYHTRLWLDAVSAAHPRMSSACLVAEDGAAVVGYMPFFFVRSGPFRRAWSLPFGTYGGPVAAGDRSVQAALLDRFRNLLSTRDVVEAGWTDFHGLGDDEGWHTYPQQTHIVDLTPGFEHLWNRAFARDRRQRSRRATKLGVVVARSHSAEDLGAHYAIYHDRMRAFATDTIQPLALFQKLFSDGGEQVRLYVARRDGEVVGTHFNFCHRSEMIAWFGMTSALGDKLQAGTLLYTECMRAACAEGLTRYNLGGSLGKESLIAYKESLGGELYRYNTYFQRSVAGRIGAALKHLVRR